MYLNAFNNDLIPREGFLSLNLFVVDTFCACLCRQVYACFALFYVDICAFPFVFADRFKFSCFSMSTSTGLRFHVFLCRQVLRLFMSTGLRFCAFLCRYLRFSLSTCRQVYGLCNYGVNVFLCCDIQSWCIFNPDVYFMTCKKIFDINHAFYSHNQLCILRIYKYVIISGRYHSNKTVKIIHNQYENGNESQHRDFNPALDSFDTY